MRRKNNEGLRNIRLCINYLQRTFRCRSIASLGEFLKINKYDIYRWYNGQFKISRRMAIKLSDFSNGRFTVQDLCPDKPLKHIRRAPRTKRYFDLLKYKLNCKNYSELSEYLGVTVQAIYGYMAHKRLVPPTIAKRMIELSENEFNIFELLPYIFEEDSRVIEDGRLKRIGKKLKRKASVV